MTGYGLSDATGGKISLSTVYRWIRARGRVQTLNTELLEVLCAALDAELAEVLEFDSIGRRSRITDAR